MTDRPRMSVDQGLSLSSLLRHAVIDAAGQALGKLSDVVTRMREADYPLLTGLVIGLGKSGYFVPMSDVISIDHRAIRLRSAKVDLRPFEARDGELLLKRNVLGNRLIDVARSSLVRAYDVRLTQASEGWIAIGLDVHKGSWLHIGRHEDHAARDWHSFLPLFHDHPDHSFYPARAARAAGECGAQPHTAGTAARRPGLQRHQGRLRRR